MNMMTPIIAPAPERLAVLAELLRRFERDEMERAVDLLIAVLDAADPDVEAEPATWTEAGRRQAKSANLPISTDDHEMSGDEEDAAFAEWKAEGRHKLYAGGQAPTRSWVSVHEDAEDDDPREDSEADCCHGGDDVGSLDKNPHAFAQGDKSVGDDTDSEYTGDEKDAAWIERVNQTKGGRRKLRAENGYEATHVGTPEDLEDDDADEEHDGREPEHEDYDNAFRAVKPRYGVDQDKGPVNVMEMYRAHTLAQLDPANAS